LRAADENRGSLLHRIDLRTGKAAQIQTAMQDGPAGAWTDAGIGRRGEIFFGATRNGAPQVWSMPAGATPIYVQLPLTEHRETDIARVQSVSANLINVAGNYELYRAGRAPGSVVQLTKTDRDEFSASGSRSSRIASGTSTCSSCRSAAASRPTFHRRPEVPAARGTRSGPDRRRSRESNGGAPLPDGFGR
jgi:hypothetical protein